MHDTNSLLTVTIPVMNQLHRLSFLPIPIIVSIMLTVVGYKLIIKSGA